MLRIHFTDADLARVRVAAEPGPLRETVLGVQQLIGPRRTPVVFAGWRHRARAVLVERGLQRYARLLAAIAPEGMSYLPDFLTPAEAAAGLGPGLEAVRATPVSRVRRQSGWLTRTVRYPRPIAWVGLLSSGGRSDAGWAVARPYSVGRLVRSSAGCLA